MSPFLLGSPLHLSGTSFHDSVEFLRGISLLKKSLLLFFCVSILLGIYCMETCGERYLDPQPLLSVVSLKCVPPCQAQWPLLELLIYFSFWLNTATLYEKKMGRMSLALTLFPEPCALWPTTQSLTILCQNYPSSSALPLFLRTWGGRAIKCILAFSP